MAQPPPGHRNHHHHHQSTPGEARSGETPDTLKRFYNRAEDSGWDRDALEMLDLDGSFSQPEGAVADGDGSLVESTRRLSVTDTAAPLLPEPMPPPPPPR